MKYKNAQDILPDKLLRELQKYVAGGVIYVPSPDSKKSWGENSGARTYYRQRNEEIREKHREGVSLQQLAEQYNISIDAIYKILY